MNYQKELALSDETLWPYGRVGFRGDFMGKNVSRTQPATRPDGAAAASSVT
ncbi:MAG: hypothetical protein WBC68_13005 [Albidovulum sp.]